MKNITYNAPMQINNQTFLGLHSAVIKDDEYDAFMESLNDPEREVTNIVVEDVPDEPQLKYTDSEMRDFTEEWMRQTGYVPDSEVEA